MYAIVESQSRGKIVLATEDLLPGIELVRENPLVFVSDADVESCQFVLQAIKTGIESKAWAVYDKFKHLSSEDKKEYMTLFGPTSFPLTRTCRVMLSRLPSMDFEYDVEEFLEVFSRMALNYISCSAGFAVYMIGTRWAHSCLPNCCWVCNDPHGRGRVIRTIRPIKKGEELTISYNTDFVINPTHERRSKYLRSKDFLCQCERCSDPADITRRFECLCTDGCKGYLCVCQPTQDDEPYLLPCTVCLVSPTLNTQVLMLQSEKQQVKAIPKGDYRNGLLQHMCEMRARREIHSAQAVPVPQLKLHYSAAYHFELHLEYALISGNHRALISTAQQLLALYEDLVPFPNKLLFDALYNVADLLEKSRTIRAMSLALKTYQRALQQLLVMDYHMGMSEARQGILRCMMKLTEMGQPHIKPSMEISCCAFCESSPHRMAMTLSQCGRCMAVLYCGKECQVTHWKVHKNECHSEKMLKLTKSDLHT